MNPNRKPEAALAVQVGGDHYKSTTVQPVEFSAANQLNALEGSIAKRITRWRVKGGLTDLLKIKHEVDLLITMEAKYPRAGAINGDYHNDLKVKCNDPVLAPYLS